MKAWLVAFVLILGGDVPTYPQHIKDRVMSKSCQEFKQLLVDIRTESISPDTAKLRFQNILKNIRNVYPTPRFDSTLFSINFPLKGLDYTRVGGRHGEGYYASKYNMFDHKIQGSHPAQDIFLRDLNADEIDDRLNKRIEWVAVADAIVLAVETGWTPQTAYRGGNFVWLYDLENGGLWYYAHASEVSVKPGQWVLRGQKLGMTGRTGANAMLKRSETHLHLMYLHINDQNLPRPVNIYQWLKDAKPSESLVEPPAFYERPYLGYLKPLGPKTSMIPLSSWPRAFGKLAPLRPVRRLRS